MVFFTLQGWILPKRAWSYVGPVPEAGLCHRAQGAAVATHVTYRLISITACAYDPCRGAASPERGGACPMRARCRPQMPCSRVNCGAFVAKRILRRGVRAISLASLCGLAPGLPAQAGWQCWPLSAGATMPRTVDWACSLCTSRPCCDAHGRWQSYCACHRSRRCRRV